jgi:hypothetical protein
LNSKLLERQHWCSVSRWLHQQWRRVAGVVVPATVAAAGCTVVRVRWAAAVSEGARWVAQVAVSEVLQLAAAGFAARKLAALAFATRKLASADLTEATTLPGVAADDMRMAVIATGTVKV